MLDLLQTDQAVQQLTTIANPSVVSEAGVQGTLFDLTNPLVIIVIIVVVIAMFYGDPKRGSGSGSGDKYKSTEVMRKEIDKDADRYQMVLRSSGQILFEGTEAECKKWRKDNVEPLGKSTHKR